MFSQTRRSHRSEYSHNFPYLIRFIMKGREENSSAPSIESLILFLSAAFVCLGLLLKKPSNKREANHKSTKLEPKESLPPDNNVESFTSLCPSDCYQLYSVFRWIPPFICSTGATENIAEKHYLSSFYFRLNF